MRRRRLKKEITIQSDETRNVFGILSLIIASLLALSFFISAPGFDLIKRYLGQSTIFAFVLALSFSLKMFRIEFLLTKTKSIIGQSLSFLTSSSLLHFFISSEEAELAAQEGRGGGELGYFVTNKYLIDYFAREGTFIILLSLTIIAITLTFNISIVKVFEIIKDIITKTLNVLKTMNNKMKEKADQDEIKNDLKDKMVGDLRSEAKLHNEEKKIISEDKLNNAKRDKDQPEKSTSYEDKPSISKKYSRFGISIDDEIIDSALINKSLNYSNWKLPPVSLLNPPEKIEKNTEDVKKNADIIEQTLQSFGVKAKVVDVMVGPTVTQYALNIALGTKVARISNLKTDLALALAAPTGAVRIEAPIPGTSYVGIEIPNSKKETVYIRTLIESNEMRNNNMHLPVCVGKRIDGRNVITNLEKMPHLLIAGATGSGKSVLTNGFIISLLMKKTPDEVRMIMVDPKQVELSDYNGIPHLLTPVITDMQKVLNSLKWAIIEMEKRYTIFRLAHVRNIIGYNEKMGFAAMPFIVIIIDEMADLMLSSSGEVENAVVKLAQKARATGIHLVLATQRPSVDVITGLIKANIPGRIGMSVATQIDSRVILDQIGAETLLGQGDMLFKEPDKPRPYRVQGVWVSQDEVRRVVKFIKSQSKEVNYASEVTQKQVDPNAPKSVIESVAFSDDEYFADAVRIVCNARKGSASLLQRKLSIGYNRAARLLDELQQNGVVGEADGSKPRKVLIQDPEEFLSRAKKAIEE